jgi:hypothetical protein
MNTFGHARTNYEGFLVGYVATVTWAFSRAYARIVSLEFGRIPFGACSRCHFF